jgi:DNA-3-methyladenine glycosylase
VRIIDAEAYKINDKGSHASLGYTEKRKALFMPAVTIYMYYARGGDSFNTSCKGKGHAVLFKTGYPFIELDDELELMQTLNPINGRIRDIESLCKGQTLICKSLNLKVPTLNAKNYSISKLELRDYGISVKKIIQCKRLGIPKGRDEDLLYRFVDFDFRQLSTKNPINKNTTIDKDYKLLEF